MYSLYMFLCSNKVQGTALPNFVHRQLEARLRRARCRQKNVAGHRCHYKGQRFQFYSRAVIAGRRPAVPTAMSGNDTQPSVEICRLGALRLIVSRDEGPQPAQGQDQGQATLVCGRIDRGIRQAAIAPNKQPPFRRLYRE